jgi:hypothetical protein
MKKTLLLSVVASTMIMAGGDIAPVEPVVEAPVEASAWNFSGQAVAYMQTRDLSGQGDLFGGNENAGALGLQLRATNDDVFAGIGFGAEVSTIAAGHNNGWSNTHFGMQEGDALTQAYLTYGMGDTSLKVGRQTLPKSLSPFAFSEGWQVFQNTFDAALVVNSSLPNTTAVYAFVTKGNGSVTTLPGHALFPWHAVESGLSSLNEFDKINEDGVHMVTLQNKSIENLTLTGTWYYGANHTDWLLNDELGLGVSAGDTNVLWGDATYKAGGITIGLQGGEIDPDGLDSTSGYGVKVAGSLAGFDLSAAYTSVDDGAIRMANFGTSVKTPLYTQSILDQDVIALDADTFKIAASTKVLGGTVGLAYINADLGCCALPAVMQASNGYSLVDSLTDPTYAYDGTGTYEEIDLTYKTKVFNDSTTVFAGYVYQDDDRSVDSQNFLRFWARYNF